MSARPTILIVEDVDVHRQLVRLSVTKLFDCTTFEAKDGLEGALMAVEHRPELVLTDLDMPRMSGLELIAFIRRCPMIATTPIVVLTLRDTARERVDVAGFGLVALLRKPLRLQELREALISAGWTPRADG